MDLISGELCNYRKHFAGKRVLCNCDNPRTSNFFRYFAENFGSLQLRSLTATCHSRQHAGLKAVITNVGNSAHVDDLSKMPGNSIEKLNGDGDFRSDECVALLKEADIVVTNPPFSLFRQFMALLTDMDKRFIVLGSLNAAVYRDIFPLIQSGRMWLGNAFGHFWFRVPDDYEAKTTDFRVDPDGSKWRRIGNICWFTNLDFPKRHEPMPLRKEYSPEAYRKYDEYDAIEVARVDDIPCGYDGRMGVPITFLTRHNPEQFDIVGLDRYVADNPRRGYRLKLGGRETYARLIIKKRVVP